MFPNRAKCRVETAVESTGLQKRERRISLRVALFTFFGVLCALAVSPSAFAQCAMCYTAAAAAGAAAARSIDYGILILLTPALLLFVGILYLLVRRASAASVAIEIPQAQGVSSLVPQELSDLT